MKRPTIRRNLPVNQRSAAARAAKEWHWGVPAKQAIDWRDPDVDRNLHDREVIEIGRLVEIRVRPPGQRKIARVSLPEASVPLSHVVFDRAHPKQRIYFLVDPDLQPALAELHNPRSAMRLDDYAVQIGSGHATRDYPPVRVTPLGRASHVLYETEKGAYWKHDEPDGLSTYIHKMGEDGGVEPGIGVDAHGRLWFAGGSYTCPRPGITR
ncbi:MAG: hypothetical protein EBZ50_06415 [Alphaproteobacteria bacterium]|nr:hypothetical protein [Alphaproteobacteria bacterium]